MRPRLGKIQVVYVLGNLLSLVLSLRFNTAQAFRSRVEALHEVSSHESLAEGLNCDGCYGIKDHEGKSYFVDEDGYFVTKPGALAGWFKDFRGGIRVMSGAHALKFMYSGFWLGSISGDSDYVSANVKWNSGEPMMWHGIPVDRYKKKWYGSRLWYTKRNYKFYKVYKKRLGSRAKKTQGATVQQEAVEAPPPVNPTSVGQIFVAYITYKGQRPSRTKEEILQLMFGTTARPTSWRDVLEASSWGQATVRKEDVTWRDIESSVDPATFLNKAHHAVDIRKVWDEVEKKTKDKSLLDKYSHAMLFVPEADGISDGRAEPLGKRSVFSGSKISWQTFAHEIAHNWGLNHAGGFVDRATPMGDGKHFFVYADDAVMGAQRTHRNPDFNAVARYRLGWIPKNQVAEFQSGTANVRALNDGLREDGNYLIMKVGCTTCVSGNPQYEKRHDGIRGGTLFVSFRMSKNSQYGHRNSLYGLNDTDTGAELYEYKTYRHLQAADHVNIHFQPQKFSGSGKLFPETELWTTLGKKGETYKVPNADLWLHVCRIALGRQARYAKVTSSSVSARDAKQRCTNVGSTASQLKVSVKTSAPAAKSLTALADYFKEIWQWIRSFWS